MLSLDFHLLGVNLAGFKVNLNLPTDKTPSTRPPVTAEAKALDRAATWLVKKTTNIWVPRMTA